MDSGTKHQPQAYESGAARAASDIDQTVANKVGAAAQAVRAEVEERGAEILDQAKQKVGEVYDQANKGVTEQYLKAVDYSRENPGTTTLIAFGIGIGVGILLLSALGPSRSREE